ncbi:MAG: MmgE/PrpD family protein [Thermodesulfobacteriota bacterium]|nr:MmgE/PrpD family protein [Thermodesulfobacteriota bacterium]
MMVNELGKFVAQCSYEDLPPAVVELAKTRFLDLLSAGLAGFQLGLYRPLFEILGGKEEATVWGAGVKYPLRDAALLNSFMSHSTYMEDGSRFTGGHPSSTVIPAALALGEMRKSNGKEIILSIVVGYDIFLRLGKAIYPSTTVRGFQSTAVVGALGSTAACASLLKLDLERCKNALAIASNLGAGLKEALKTPDSQPLQVGRSSEGGILSALFAEKGVSGCDTILENGFLKAFADQTNENEILLDLGRKYLIEETYVKIHGGCRGNHAPTDVIQSLVREHNLLPDEIKEIRVKVDSVTMIAEIHHPMSGKQAQFSIPFSIAVAILDGNASLYQFSNEKVNDPKVRALMAKVSVEVDKSLDKDYPNKRGSHGEIILRDGRRLSSSINNARGEPESSLSVQEIREKFILLAGDILGRRTEEVCDQIMNLEELEDIGGMIHKLKA